MLSIGPRNSLPKVMVFAVALLPVVPATTAEPEMETTMPSFRSPELWSAPSSSVMAALLSSKRTPLTMMEPKPVMAPLENDPVPPLPTVAMLPRPLKPPPPKRRRTSPRFATAAWKIIKIRRATAIPG